jgi:hypothetical protein
MAKSRGRSGGFFGKIVWFIIILSLIFAWFKTPVPAGTSVIEFAQAKSKSVEAWVKNTTAGGFSLPDFLKGSDGLSIDIGGEKKPLGDKPAPSGAPVDSAKANTVLDTVTIANAEKVSYNREEWKHWSSAGSSCWDTREAVLYAEAVPGSVKLLDKDKKPTTDKAKACSIESGEWNDPYAGKKITNPKSLDVDHMIPLSYAAQHGGQAWDAKKKEAYANSQDFAGHLVAADAGQNRTKGDKGPSQWKPSNKAYYCEYENDWVTVAKTWNLSITDADKAALKDMLATC